MHSRTPAISTRCTWWRNSHSWALWPRAGYGARVRGRLSTRIYLAPASCTPPLLTWQIWPLPGNFTTAEVSTILLWPHPWRGSRCSGFGPVQKNRGPRPAIRLPLMEFGWREAELSRYFLFHSLPRGRYTTPRFPLRFDLFGWSLPSEQ